MLLATVLFGATQVEFSLPKKVHIFRNDFSQPLYSITKGEFTHNEMKKTETIYAIVWIKVI